MAASHGSFKLIADLCEKNKTNVPQLNILLLANSSIINKQPDVFTQAFLDTLKSILTTVDDNLTKKHCLKCMQRACLMHENNRQMIVEADMLTVLKPYLFCEESFLLKEVCCLFRYLVLDDDIRVEFGKAHEHARLIATETLEDITKLLNSKLYKFTFVFRYLLFYFHPLQSSTRNRSCWVI